MNTTHSPLRQELTDQAPLRAVRIPLGKIRVHPRNLRSDLGDLTVLAESLIHDGQFQPALVHRRGEFFELLDGHRRYGASVIARRRTLDCVVVPPRSDADAIRGMLATAVHARQLTGEERAHGIDLLISEFGATVAEVATHLGVTPATVRRWRAGEADAVSVKPAARAADGVGGCRSSRRAATTVSVRRVADVVERWESRATGGLSAADATGLITELRALVPSSPVSTPKG